MPFTISNIQKPDDIDGLENISTAQLYQNRIEAYFTANPTPGLSESTLELAIKEAQEDIKRISFDLQFVDGSDSGRGSDIGSESDDHLKFTATPLMLNTITSGTENRLLSYNTNSVNYPPTNFPHLAISSTRPGVVEVRGGQFNTGLSVLSSSPAYFQNKLLFTLNDSENYIHLSNDELIGLNRGVLGRKSIADALREIGLFNAAGVNVGGRDITSANHVYTACYYIEGALGEVNVTAQNWRPVLVITPREYADTGGVFNRMDHISPANFYVQFESNSDRDFWRSGSVGLDIPDAPVDRPEDYVRWPTPALSGIQYFRRIERPVSPVGSVNQKVIKEVKAVRNGNYERDDGGNYIYEPIPVKPPVLVYEKGRHEVKNKGSVLGRKNLATRQSARTVMGLSANAQYFNPEPDAEGNSDLSRKGLTRDWCHLHGHGDGGGEFRTNFVCGSTNCNTEQLAIERAVRFFSQKEREGTFQLRSTAYLRSPDRADPFTVFRVRTDNPVLNKCIKLIYQCCFARIVFGIDVETIVREKLGVTISNDTFGNYDTALINRILVQQKDRAIQFLEVGLPEIWNLINAQVTGNADAFVAHVTPVCSIPSAEMEPVFLTAKLNPKVDLIPIIHGINSPVILAELQQQVPAVDAAIDPIILAEVVLVAAFYKAGFISGTMLKDILRLERLHLSPQNQTHIYHITNSFGVLPIAEAIRYKVFKRVEEPPIQPGTKTKRGQIERMFSPASVRYEKIFEHTFEGQSDFFDKNQYKIVYHTVKKTIGRHFHRKLDEEYQRLLGLTKP